MSPKQEHVERELLTIAFRTYPRGLANGFVAHYRAGASDRM